MKIYYAHCIAIYNTPQEQRDLNLIKLLFPAAKIYNPNNDKAQEGAKEDGMDFFKPIVQMSDLLVFRALPDGKIPAGVCKEIEWAKEVQIPVIELPGFVGRQMSVDDTRQYLRELGTR